MGHPGVAPPAGGDSSRAESIQRLEVTHAFERIGKRTMLLNARRVDQIDFILLALEDVTERRQAEMALRESERRFQLIAAEVDHRAKNLLALVQAMLRMTRAETVEEFVGAVSGRINALARAHTLLSASRWRSADLHQLIREELAPYASAAATPLHMAGPPCALSATAAQSLAMALHELATNAAKYGALSVRQGSLAVEWRCGPDQPLALRWQETGGPPVHAPEQRGMGAGLIERTVQDQLGGEVSFDWHADGLVCEVKVPAGQLVQAKP